MPIKTCYNPEIVFSSTVWEIKTCLDIMSIHMFQMVSAHCQMWCFLWQWLKRNFNTKMLSENGQPEYVYKVIESLKIDYDKAL